MSSQLQVTGEAKIRDIQGPVVANSGVITALDGAASQYVRGDGTLADFPSSTGGGSSVSYYLNSSVSQGTIGGVAYRELNKEPIIGAGTDIAISANGYVASYLTDANDPDVLSIPGGNFNCEFYFSVSNDTGNPFFYAELYKYDGTTFTLLGSSVGVPEYINQGTIIAPYYFAIPVPTSALALTDRLAIRIYVNVDGRTVTLHTENSHLCQVVTTLSKGMVSLNNLTDQSQYLTTGTSGTDFNIVSSGDTHTFNLPIASATNTGKLSSTDWSTFNGKVPYTGATGDVNLGLFSITSNAVKAIGDNSTYGGIISIKQNNVIGGLLGTGYTELFGKTNRLGISFGAGSIANLSNSVLTAERTYTLPDLSGTLALLEGSQTFTGVKTFSDNPVINGTGTNSAYTILQSAGTNKWRIGNNYASGVNTFDIFAYDNSSTPLSINSNGAMTLSANVTTTGAQFVQNGFYLTNANGGSLAGYTHMWARNEGINFGLRNGTGGASFIFPSANSYNYTFPAASGTLALSSDLSAYLPLAGGTLTGALSGTSATFSGIVTASSANTNGFAFGTTSRIRQQDASTRIEFVTFDASGLYDIAAKAATFSSSVGVGGAPSGTYGTLSVFGGISTKDDNNGKLEIGRYSSGAPNSYIKIGTNSGSLRITNAADSADLVTFTNGGNVGIGTSSPTSYGGFTTLNINNATNGGLIDLLNNGTRVGTFFNTSSDVNIGSITSVPFIFYTANTERMRITSGGNVGIGTSSAPYLLTLSLPSGVNGEIIRMSRSAGSYAWSLGIDGATSHFNFYNNSSSSVANINLSTGAYTATSDERLKENILDSDNAIEKLLKIKVRKYDWKDTDIKEDYGFVAQELYDVLPQYVSKGDEDRNWGVAKAELVPMLVKAIQELKAEIDELKNK